MKNNKITNALGFVAVLVMLTACTETPVEKEVITPVEKEVIIVKEKETVIVPAPKVIEKETPEKTTKVVIGDDGVKIDSKKIDIEVKK